MEKERREDQDTQKEICTNVFKNGILTKEDYTNVWIELISVSERRERVIFSPSQ